MGRYSGMAYFARAFLCHGQLENKCLLFICNVHNISERAYWNDRVAKNCMLSMWHAISFSIFP